MTVVLQSLDLAIAAQAVAKSSVRAYMVHTTTWLATLQHQVQLALTRANSKPLLPGFPKVSGRSLEVSGAADKCGK